MKFKLGDFVRFVDEKREGYVTSVIDANTLGVTDTDGFEIPVPLGNLTHVHGQFTEEREEDSVAVDSAPISYQGDPGIFLFLAQDKKANGVLHFHLMNNTQNILLASLTSIKNTRFKGEFRGVLASYESTLIFSAGLPDLGNWPELNLQLLIHSANEAPSKPIVFQKRFKAKDFDTTKVHLAGLESLGWKIRLDEEKITIDPKKLKESFFNQEKTKPTVQPPADEVDLHIERLRDDFHFMQSTEILKEQLACFEKNMEAALVHRKTSIIFIHGVGNGVLQHQIHKLLSKHPQVRTFKDARKERFGYGATEVFFK